MGWALTFSMLFRSRPWGSYFPLSVIGRRFIFWGQTVGPPLGARTGPPRCVFSTQVVFKVLCVAPLFSVWSWLCKFTILGTGVYLWGLFQFGQRVWRFYPAQWGGWRL